MKPKLGGKKQYGFQVSYCEVVLISRWLPVGVTENWNETDFLCWTLNGYSFLEEDCMLMKERMNARKKEIKP